MESVYTLLQTEGISDTKRIQELALSTQPYSLAKVTLRLYQDTESLRERILMLETENDAYKLLLSAHDNTEES